MAKIEYVRCPRCELNYINKKDKLCMVCQMELQNRGTNCALESEDLELGVCPICKTNYISEDETMCALCLKEKEMEDSLAGDVDENENWRMYVESEDQETEEDEVGEMSSVTDVDDDILAEDLDFGLDEEFEEENEQEFEEDYEDDEDFDDFDDEDYDDLDDEDDED